MSIKAKKLTIDEHELLTKSEAMGLSRRETEKTFDEEIGKYVQRKCCGNKKLYPKSQVIKVMMHPMYNDPRPAVPLPKNKSRD